MNKVSVGTLAISLAAAGVILAQAPASTVPKGSQGHAAHMEFKSVDTNSDGRISREEARANVELTTNFGTLDGDTDTYLSQAEFAKWNQMGKGMKDKETSNYSTPKTPASP
jgi:Ca2+-binding EF-hand superfamily protein